MGWKKWVPVVVMVAILCWGLVSCVNDATSNVTSGVGKDLSDMTDVNKMQSKQVDPNNPLHGILSEKGMFSSTGKAVGAEATKAGNAVNDFFTFLLVGIIVVVAVFYFMTRRK